VTQETPETHVSDATAEQLERNRRRFVRRQWARRWLRWRAVVALVLAIVLLVGGIWLVFFSSVLTVKGVDVEGTGFLRVQQVRAVAAVPSGEPLARIDLEAISQRIAKLPPVKDVDVSREWPDRVLITVTERVPVAVVQHGEGYSALDADGVLFRDYPRRPKELPLISAGEDVDRDAMVEGAAVAGSLPAEIRRRVDHVEVESIDQISLVLRDERTVLWGSASRSADKADVLEALLKASPKAKEYDVSVPGQPTTRD
jgi:cell division protein FtsQ